MSYRDHVFRFQDVDQVRRSLQRISQDNLTEEEAVLDVQFLGVLPHRRTFEFKLPDADEVLSGKISPLVAQVDAINDHRHQTVPAE